MNQAKSVLHVSNYYYIEQQAKLAQKIVENSCADRVFFGNSGAEANEGAIKLAKIYHYKKGNTEKYEIITLVNSFHGRTLATVAATGQEKFSAPYHPLTPGFQYVPINDLEAFKNAVTQNKSETLCQQETPTGSIQTALIHTNSESPGQKSRSFAGSYRSP